MGNIIGDKCECFTNKLEPGKSKLNPRNSNQQLLESQDKHSNSSSQKPSHSESIRSIANHSKEHNGVPKKTSIDDFTLVKVVGKGSYGKVYLVQHRKTLKYHAMKKLDKAKIISQGLTESTFTERDVLCHAHHPFVVGLQYSFQNETTLYMVMDYLVGGELFTHIKNKGRFNEDEARFYAAEVVLALQYLHEDLDVMYRDLKPENILLDAEGHVKITDFGLAKAKQKATEMAGTPEYLAPEIIEAYFLSKYKKQYQSYDKSVDWWTLGCLIYEMLAGRPPFQNRDWQSLFHMIQSTEPKMLSFFSTNAKDLLTRLLTKNPKQRLGSEGAEEIKKHPFFKDVDWKKLYEKKITPKIRPMIQRADDVSNFDKRYVNQPAIETPSDPTLLRGHSKDFAGFTYMGNERLNQKGGGNKW